MRWTLAPLYVALCVATTAATLARFAQIVQPYLSVRYSWRFELGMVVGQVLFQWAVMFRRPWRDRLAYMLVVLSVSLAGSLALWPLLALHRRQPTPPLVAVGYFFVVVGMMFLVHRRAVARAQLPHALSYTWVLYRCLILLWIL